MASLRWLIEAFTFEIDLWATSLSEASEAGRGTKATRAAAGVSRRRTASAPTDRAQNKAIREWARSKRKKISDRGRIPEEIVADYHASAGR